MTRIIVATYYCSFPGSSDGKESAWNAGDPASIPGSGRSPGEGSGNPLQSSCLEEEPGGLQSMGSQRVGHDWTTDTHITSTQSSLSWLVWNRNEGFYLAKTQRWYYNESQALKSSVCSVSPWCLLSVPVSFCEQLRSDDHSVTILKSPSLSKLNRGPCTYKINHEHMITGNLIQWAHCT